METKNPLLIVEEILNTARPADPGAYALVFSQGLVELVRHRDIPSGCEVICHLTSDHINKGLSSALWDRIEAKIRILQKKSTLQTPTPTPLFKDKQYV